MASSNQDPSTTAPTCDKVQQFLEVRCNAVLLAQVPGLRIELGEARQAGLHVLGVPHNPRRTPHQVCQFRAFGGNGLPDLIRQPACMTSKSIVRTSGQVPAVASNHVCGRWLFFTTEPGACPSEASSKYQGDAFCMLLYIPCRSPH